ncbi:MAG: glutamine-hydrolyzing carbamoyl-phosphate synthase small subunit [Elusimicrobia bacterium]|nr:glutamine-hydrolyzing carbamoyl-phosphate synthase small subunit [Candidatus Liberimonas magnetica]
MNKKAKIALENGVVFEGSSFGAEGERDGEVIFNTSMSGYQEILTDPSYKGQIVAMTYPLIGNYGVNTEDVESGRVSVDGFVVKEASRLTSNWRSKQDLSEYLKENSIIGLEGIDTRALTRSIRLKGALKAVISTEDLNDKSLIRKAQESPGLVGRDLVKLVTCDKPYLWNKKGKYKVAAIDSGIKLNILRELEKNNCQVHVFPAKTSVEKILDIKPHGLFLANGPGDPSAVQYLVKTVKQLIGRIPIFGICLGQQMLGLALGGKTYKLKFGHHGGNHPVKDLRTGKIYITAQNHGFCVDINSLNKNDIEITHMNLYDNTLEGFRHKKLPIFCVQFHPEASPGPHEAEYLFKEFTDLMEKKSAKKK